MSITTSGGYVIVDFDVDTISGSRALGAYVLSFSINYSMPAHEKADAYFHKTSAKVYVGKDNICLGLATPEQPKTYKPQKHQQKGSLLYETFVSKDSLEAIEILREGGELEFKLEISGEYYDGLNMLCNSESIRYKASQNKWIETLKLMGFKGGMVFELPMDIRPCNDVKTALVALDKAKSHLYHGNYDEVISKCRVSLESIVSNWGSISEVRKLAKNNNRRGMSKQQRFFHAVDQIINFTHLAHHADDNNEYISFTRSEAVFVLGSTISVISCYVEDKI
ncbi:MAG: hypothetical protein AB2806_21555 [Candidatus Thiodiazotropha sp.]